MYKVFDKSTPLKDGEGLLCSVVSKMRNCARRACDSGVKSSLELEMLCHCSRGSERAQVSRVNERACFRVSVGVWCW